MQTNTLTSRLLPVAILVIGGLIAYTVMNTSPRPQARPASELKPIVDTIVVSPGNHRPQWTAGGVVRAAEQLSIEARVSGEIIALNPQATPGALLTKDTWLAQIDPSDYQLSIDTQKALLIQAQSDLTLERGQQLLAREEFELAGANLSPTDKSLVLREPQIAAAQAKLKQVHSDLARAELNLKRTRINMPFDGQLIDRHISRGSQVNTSAELYELINTDHFWLEVKVPRRFIRWLDHQTQATIRQPNAWPAGESRQARILNVRPDVDSNDRQVKVVLEIDDPLSLKHPEKPQLLVNDFVEVTLFGNTIENTFALSPDWVYNGNQVWLVNANDELEKATLSIDFNGRNQLLGRGLPQANNRLVTSRMDFAAPGLAVKPRTDDSDHNQPTAKVAGELTHE